MTEALVLGIETSCDETGIGIVRGNTLLANVIATSVSEHAQFGGVVPEVASRAHLSSIIPSLKEACNEANISLDDLDAISVTHGPGLVGSLLVGVATAKGLAVSLGKPLYAVNHLAAHVAVDQLEHGIFTEPLIALLVSGGHSSVLQVNDIASEVTPLGATLDDAAGEAFDKIARVLGLGFPGGPEIDALSKSGNKDAIEFPRGLSKSTDLVRHQYDFSFSGLKTAVARWVKENPTANKADVAASFQEAVVDVLVTKSLAACKNTGIETLLIGGGVAANSRLREMAETKAKNLGVKLRVPRPGLCTDNGAMVASLGASLLRAGIEPSPLTFSVDSGLDVEEISDRV